MLLLGNGSLDDGGVECVWDQADDDSDLANLVLEGSLIGDIEGDGVAVLQAFTELLGRVEGSTGW